jgi:hypothetical protein
MCTLKSIRIEVMLFVYGKACVSLYLFYAGCFLASSVQLHQGYGSAFKGYGAGLIILGMMSGFAAVPFRWSVDKHNRFVLVVCFCVDLLVMSLLLLVSSEITSHTVSTFSKALQLDCLSAVPQVRIALPCRLQWPCANFSFVCLYSHRPDIVDRTELLLISSVMIVLLR